MLIEENRSGSAVKILVVTAAAFGGAMVATLATRALAPSPALEASSVAAEKMEPFKVTTEMTMAPPTEKMARLPAEKEDPNCFKDTSCCIMASYGVCNSDYDTCPKWLRKNPEFGGKSVCDIYVVDNYDNYRTNCQGPNNYNKNICQRMEDQHDTCVKCGYNP